MNQKEKYTEIHEEIIRRGISIAEYAKENNLKAQTLYSAFYKYKVHNDVETQKPVGLFKLPNEENSIFKDKKLKVKINGIDVEIPFSTSLDLQNILRTIKNV